MGSSTERVPLHISGDVSAEGRSMERSDRHHRQDGGIITYHIMNNLVILRPLLHSVLRKVAVARGALTE